MYWEQLRTVAQRAYAVLGGPCATHKMLPLKLRAWGRALPEGTGSKGGRWGHALMLSCETYDSVMTAATVALLTLHTV